MYPYRFPLTSLLPFCPASHVPLPRITKTSCPRTPGTAGFFPIFCACRFRRLCSTTAKFPARQTAPFSTVFSSFRQSRPFLGFSLHFAQKEAPFSLTNGHFQGTIALLCPQNWGLKKGGVSLATQGHWPQRALSIELLLFFAYCFFSASWMVGAIVTTDMAQEFGVYTIPIPLSQRHLRGQNSGKLCRRLDSSEAGP